MSYHCERVSSIFDEMFSLLPVVLSVNRAYISNYLNVWTDMSLFVWGLDVYDISEPVRTKFQSFYDSEDERIKKNLELIKYDIDELNTLSLITGGGRIEKVCGSGLCI